MEALTLSDGGDRSMERQRTKIEDLPEELMLKILCRLPIHSVSQSRYVSPKWRSLINHPSFSKMHYAYHSSQNPPNPTSLILVDEDMSPKPQGYVYCVPDLETCETEEAIKLTRFRSQHCFNPDVRAFINGFLCYELEMNFYFCNVVSGDFIKIDLPTPQLYCDCYGFGWDKTNDEYKLVIMYRTAKDLKFLQVDIHTLGSATWKSIGIIPNDISRVHSKGVFVNGHVHWSVSKEGNDFKNMVQCLRSVNVEDESIGAVSIPHHLTHLSDIYLQLGEFQGCLMLTDCSTGSLQVWLMKDYGMQQSWVLQYIIPGPDNCLMVRPFFLKPLALLKNGNILLECHVHFEPTYTELSSYDTKTRRHKFLRVQGKQRSLSWTYPYVPTLVKLEDVIAKKEK